MSGFELSAILRKEEGARLGEEDELDFHSSESQMQVDGDNQNGENLRYWKWWRPRFRKKFFTFLTTKCKFFCTADVPSAPEPLEQVR